MVFSLDYIITLFISWAPVAEWVSHSAGTQEVGSSTPGPSPPGGMVATEKWCVVWGCLWPWQLKNSLGSIEKGRALCPGPRFLSRPDITINVCERSIKLNSINQSINLMLLQETVF